jgi:hypothetical protein
MAQEIIAVAAGADDAQEEHTDTNFQDSNNPHILQASYSPESQPATYVGCRFVVPNIASGTTITATTMSIYVVTQDDPDCKIYCQASDNAPNYTTDADVVNRAVTTANTTWNTTNIGLGLKSTPDFTGAMQEVISRAGWAAGNACNVIMRGSLSDSANEVRFDAYEAAGANQPVLTITYTAAGANNRIHEYNDFGRLNVESPGVVAY